MGICYAHVPYPCYQFLCGKKVFLCNGGICFFVEYYFKVLFPFPLDKNGFAALLNRRRIL